MQRFSYKIIGLTKDKLTRIILSRKTPQENVRNGHLNSTTIFSRIQ